MIFDHAHEIVPDDVFLRVSDVVPDGEFFLKIEGLNPAGSIKLKTAVAMVGDAEEQGVLKPGSSIIESSSGSLGMALSLVSAGKGYSFTCVTDVKASPRSVAYMRALGSQVVIIDQPDENGGHLGARLAYLHDRLAADPDLVWLNQYANPANAEVHARLTASLILRTIGHIDYLFVGAGTTGTLMGCVAHFREHSPRTRIVAVDAEGSVTFGFPAGPRYIPGIGTSRRPELCRPEAVDDVILVSEQDTVRACRWLARRHGLLAGGSTGSVLSAVLGVADAFPPRSRVVAISPDLGDSYLHTVYDDKWVLERLRISAVEEYQSGLALTSSGMV